MRRKYIIAAIPLILFLVSIAFIILNIVTFHGVISILLIALWTFNLILNGESLVTIYKNYKWEKKWEEDWKNLDRDFS